jgi:hypothetical protein
VPAQHDSKSVSDLGEMPYRKGRKTVEIEQLSI